MSANPDSTLLDTLTPSQIDVLKALVDGLSITKAAEIGGVHRSTVHLWTRHHPAFARALLLARQDRADCLIDELAGLHQLAIDTFREILSDPKPSASVRLKAAKIVKLVESQRPSELAVVKNEARFDRLFSDLDLSATANAEPPPLPANQPARRENRSAMRRAPAAAASSTNGVVAIHSPAPRNIS